MSTVKHRVAGVLAIACLITGALVATSGQAGAISDCHGWPTKYGARAICGSTAGTGTEMRVVASCYDGSISYGDWAVVYGYSDAHCPGESRARDYFLEYA